VGSDNSAPSNTIEDEFVEDVAAAFELDLDLDDPDPRGTEFALGTSVGAAPKIFDVIIHYGDPHSGRVAQARSWNIEVSARQRDEARRLAVNEFRLVESLSSLPKQREILRVEILDGDGAEKTNPATSPYLS